MTFRIACLAAALACMAAAHAESPMTRDEAKAQLVRIEEHYDQSQARCKRVQGHARALCNEDARGERDIEVAQLQFQVEPTADNDEKLRLAKAEARYAKALIECKEMDGQSRDVCRQDAKSVYEDAKADAKLQKEVAAVTLRSEDMVRVRTAESERIAQAQFNAARERCEALPPEGRLNCMEDVRKRFPDVR